MDVEDFYMAQDVSSWDVTLDLGVRGSYVTFVVAKDEVTAAAKAALNANSYLAPGWYIEGVTVKLRS